MKKISALIAVRGGSDRIKNKNIKDFAGTNLLQLKIDQLKRVNLFEEIIVSTDSNKMIEIAKNSGVKVNKRPNNLATSFVPMNQVYFYLAGLCKFEHVLYAHVTSPLLKDQTLIDSVKIYQTLQNDYDCLASVKTIREYLWSKNKAINYDPLNHPRSQDLEALYALNFAINLISKGVMIKNKNIIGRKPFLFSMNEIESIDIDYEEDFKLAELIFKQLKG